jgi:glycosyltransferase involved in cell wall biosynthesis
MATGGFSVVLPNEGNVEYLENEKNCLFYDSSDLSTAVKQIERIANDAELRAKLLANSKKTVKDHEWKELTKSILALYE